MNGFQADSRVYERLRAIGNGWTSAGPFGASSVHAKEPEVLILDGDADSGEAPSTASPPPPLAVEAGVADESTLPVGVATLPVEVAAAAEEPALPATPPAKAAAREPLSRGAAAASPEEQTPSPPKKAADEWVLPSTTLRKGPGCASIPPRSSARRPGASDPPPAGLRSGPVGIRSHTATTLPSLSSHGALRLLRSELLAAGMPRPAGLSTNALPAHRSRRQLSLNDAYGYYSRNSTPSR